jgi:hypothetical protein
MRHFGRKSLLVNENLPVALRDLRADKRPKRASKSLHEANFFKAVGVAF